MIARTVLIVFAILSSLPAPAANRSIAGFTPQRAAKQQLREAEFDSLLKSDNLRDWMRRMSAHPHHVGSPHGKANAEFIAERFRAWGYETTIESFEILFPTPKLRLLEMTHPEEYRASLSEPQVEGDATSNQQDEALPPYNAYSIDGDVTGELVYVHYGRPDEYEELARLGVDVKGKIVLARYGGSWRGIKPKVAAEHGAIGCILYSDPRDDGYFRGDVYPQGSFKNDRGVQRGSVMDMPVHPGDPLTPGIGSVPGAPRLSREQAATLTKIPVLPISYSDALPLLAAIGGTVAPPSWRGALPVTYHVGPGPAKVHLRLEFEWKQVQAHNVIARLEGAERPDQWIMRGNHHDAWVHGANDPLSGLVAMMEEARGIGELVRAGWKPKRTLVYAAWDAEEPGLIGSTEWVETHAEELSERLAVYINSDSNGRGFLSAGGSHTLEKFLNQVSRDVVDPQKGISVAERARARLLLHGSPTERVDARQRDDLRLHALGSGSDYTPFLQHLGIASLNLGFGGENAGGEYHSSYDSFDYYTRFGDPGFSYGLTLARTTGRAMMRLADADFLPFAFDNFVDTIEMYLDQLTELTAKMREETDLTNRLIEERVHEAVADPQQPFVPLLPQSDVPHLNFAPLQNRVEKLGKSSQRYAEAWAEQLAGDKPLTVETLIELDRRLYRTERALTRSEGLPGRPWFRHFIYAPGFYTGYGVKTLPGVREAIEQRKWGRVEREIVIAAETLARLDAEIVRAAEIIESIER